MSKPLILLASLGLAATASAADITVSPNDPNALTKARDTARAGDRIILRGGTYRLSEPLVLGPQHSGVTWMAAPGEKPVISGGVPVTGWTPDPANPKIFQAKVDLDNFRQIWINGVRGQRARGRVPAGLAPLGENKGVLKPRATPAGLTLNPGGFPPGSAMQLSDLGEFPPSGFTTSDERLLTWRNPQDIEMGGRIAWNQASFMVSKISKVDGKVVLEVAQPGYFICTNMAGAPMRGPGWMENAYELIDQPGEWYFDRPAKTLFYLPRPGEDLAKAEIIAPRLETLVRVEGTIDKPVQGLRFDGLTFSHATWLRLSSAWGFPNIQGNFCVSPENGYMRAEGGWVNLSDEFLKTPGNVVVHAGHGLRFDSCTFTALGGSGLDLEYGSQNNVVSRCHFFDIAGTAVQIGDLQRHDHHPDDPRLIVKDNQLIDSEITKV
ncbi:MAG: right-handed parallel beta-helix repeat-containing protein, partial [bacterium]